MGKAYWIDLRVRVRLRARARASIREVQTMPQVCGSCGVGLDMKIASTTSSQDIRNERGRG